MPQDVEQAAFADADAFNVDPPPASELRAERQNASALDAKTSRLRPRRRPRRRRCRGRRTPMRPPWSSHESRHPGDSACWWKGRIHRMAGGVQVHRNVHVRQHHAVEKVRQHLRKRSARVARKAAIQVAIVHGREPGVVEHRRNVDGRHHDDATPNFRRIATRARAARPQSGPSYSSPWTPPVNRTVGPLPFFTTMIGISTVPQPEVLRESGARR